MGLDVWFREDIARALTAAELASRATARALERNGLSEPEVVQYRQGYQDALEVVAAAFGTREEEDLTCAPTLRSLATSAKQPAIYG